MNEPYENLKTAIVMQAVKDWRKAVRYLKKHPDSSEAEAMKADCEEFFKSDWFVTLTGMNGNRILRRLEQEDV